MTIDRDYVRGRLQKIGYKYGGYYGTDIVEIAEELDVTPFGLKKQISKWTKEDPTFANLTYIGKHRPSVTLDEFREIRDRRRSNPLEVKKHILSNIRDKRELRGEDTLSTATFYRRTKQVELSLFRNNECYRWFSERKIEVPRFYSVEAERESLSNVFHFHDLKAYGGADIEAIYERFTKAKERFSRYEVDPMRFYPALLSKGTKLRSLLTSIPPAQQEAIQARIIFEIQAAFVVECKDILIAELLHRKGRDQQSMNDSRPRLQNVIRKRVIDSIRSDIGDMVTLSGPDMAKLKKIAYPPIGEEELSKMVLLQGKKRNYELILDVLNRLTNGMKEDVTFHTENLQRLYDLACDENRWKFWTDEEKSNFVRDPTLVCAINQGNWGIAKLKAIDRIVEYIRNGKITFGESYYYQDIGARINEVQIEEGEGFLTPEILDKLIEGTFNVNIWPLLDAVSFKDLDYDDNEGIPPFYVNLSDVLKEVSRYVREKVPGWFDEHIRVFREQTDGMFSMEYSEEEFAERLYAAIGYLGRNMRYRDDKEFWNLRYFIQRYISEATLMLEMSFIHRCFTAITGNEVEAVVIDTMGLDNRKKSILATYHGRYYTIGIADLRAVSTDMKPIHSSGCRSTDSEAMNIVSVMDEVQRICGENVRIYTGDAHTVSRVCAGMVFLSHGVVAAGRLSKKTKKRLGKRAITHLKENISLLNKVGKLLKEDPTLGRAIAMKEYIFVDGVNVRKLIDDLGYLILFNVSRIPIPIHDICNAVELSNYLKRKTRIVEASYTRVEKHEAGLLLKSSELVISIVGLYHVITGWKGPESPFKLSDIRLYIPA
jgi:hypothetical protein